MTIVRGWDDLRGYLGGMWQKYECTAKNQSLFP